MENDLQGAKKYWQDLFRAILDCTLVYAHVWQPGDLVLWDNSQVMHTGIPYDSEKDQRIALRVGVVDSRI